MLGNFKPTFTYSSFAVPYPHISNVTSKLVEVSSHPVLSLLKQGLTDTIVWRLYYSTYTDSTQFGLTKWHGVP